MSQISIWTVQDGDEQESLCARCGRQIYEGEGTLKSEGGNLADYGYRWTNGHEARFLIGIYPLNAEGDRIAGLAVVSGRIENGNIIYSALDPADSPWKDAEIYGKVLTREQIFEENVVPNLWDLVDAVSANEPRISSRVLGRDEASSTPHDAACGASECAS